jgi:hypothetical protein
MLYTAEKQLPPGCELPLAADHPLPRSAAMQKALIVFTCAWTTAVDLMVAAEKKTSGQKRLQFWPAGSWPFTAQALPSLPV